MGLEAWHRHSCLSSDWNECCLNGWFSLAWLKNCFQYSIVRPDLLCKIRIRFNQVVCLAAVFIPDKKPAWKYFYFGHRIFSSGETKTLDCSTNINNLKKIGIWPSISKVCLWEGMFLEVGHRSCLCSVVGASSFFRPGGNSNRNCKPEQKKIDFTDGEKENVPWDPTGKRFASYRW